MFKFDHFVVNINKKYQKDKNIINSITNAGFPYKPSWGKGTRGFKASNLWVGNEYLEMINIIKPDGGGWKSDWVDLYHKGHRGVVCIMLDVKAMPWQNCYSEFLEGVPLQIGFQQMDDQKSREFMEQYMVPNSRDNNIEGINKVVVRGSLTDSDKKLISSIFDTYVTSTEPLTIKLNDRQVLVFEESNAYSVHMTTSCNNQDFNNKVITIENIVIENTELLTCEM